MGAAVIPVLRRPTSSLSTTLALAVIAFLFIEFQGIRANGVHYFERFFQVGSWRRAHQGMMTGLVGNIQAGLVGPLELISEFIRIVTFSFRLFGNMFAGTVLVFVMMSILPVLLPAIFLGLEFAIAVIQAFVFMMLITVFTSLAVAHGEH
jgi:F-type H+-transporting ATPase subunit a